jgi:hypothetical protein
LIWLKQVSCLSSHDWAGGSVAAAGLKDGQCHLTDGSSPGDWRLPTKAEWSATIAHAVTLGCTVALLTNDAGTSCWVVGPSSFMDAYFFPTVFWSSTSAEVNPQVAWLVSFGGGGIRDGQKGGIQARVWPVRGGPR